MYHSARPSRLLGDIAPSERSGNNQVAALCDKYGEVYWWDTKDLEVVSVGQTTPADILSKFSDSEEGTDDFILTNKPSEVKAHPRYDAFLKEDMERYYIYKEDLVDEFNTWLTK